MSRSINKIILVGNVGRDPDIHVTQAGTKVAHLSLATSRRIPKNGAVEERTDWHRLTVWDRLAELVEDYVRKGDRLYVEGRMEYDSFERDGTTVPTAEVQVRELVMLGSASRANGAGAGAAVEEEIEDAAAEEEGTGRKGGRRKAAAVPV
ncbi:MAG TPA: single-stranded DNA-binding protein [Longimicrobiales bacterium]|nr:single-stranded DNA-binding protein [Longimicrobiales bacterium]